MFPTPESQLFFAATDGKKPIAAVATIFISSKSITLITLAALHLQGEGLSIYSGGTHLKLQYYLEAQALNYSADQKNLVIEFIDNEGIKNKITSSGLLFSVNTQQSKHAITPSEHFFSIPIYKC